MTTPTLVALQQRHNTSTKRGGGGVGFTNSRQHHRSSWNKYVPRRGGPFLAVLVVMIITVRHFHTVLFTDFDFLMVQLTTTTTTPTTTPTRRRGQSSTSSSSSSLLLAGQQLQRSSPPPSSRKRKRRRTIAYVISLIKCGDHQSNIGGMVDAAAVLRHSIHRQHTNSTQYHYKMYAIAHKQAESCSEGLKDLGFHILLRDTPIRSMDEIQSDELRKIVPRAWCCGAAEFIKLYAYTLTQHDLVVHVDVDFLFTKPMDNLYDAMLLSNNYEDDDGGDGETTATAAWQSVPREFPNEPVPKVVEAAMTRDWPQVRPGRIPGFQAGFIVLKPSVEIFEQILNTIRTTEYVGGFSRENGWGGKGYGAFVGSAAMQGLMAYFYDHVRPNTWIELNQCRYNHMGMDVLYRSQPNFQRNHAQAGQCRNNRGMDCEDCQITPLEQIYSIHYTQCRKPWGCIGEGSSSTNRSISTDKRAIPEDSVLLDHCMILSKEWNAYRSDLEHQLLKLITGGDDESSSVGSIIRNGQAGLYKPDIFQGHCKDYGPEHYLPIAGSGAGIGANNNETIILRKRIPELYSEQQLQQQQQQQLSSSTTTTATG